MPDSQHNSANSMAIIFGSIAGAALLTVFTVLLIFRIQRRRFRGEPQFWQRRRRTESEYLEKGNGDRALDASTTESPGDAPVPAPGPLPRRPTIQFAETAKVVRATVFPKTPRAPPPIASPGVSPALSTPGLLTPGLSTPGLSTPGLSRWERYGRDHADM